MRCGYPAIAQLTFPWFSPAMPGNGCPGQVDEGVGSLGSGVEESGLGIPEHMWQFVGWCSLGRADFRPGAKQPN